METPDFTITRFNQGETYRSRTVEALRKLKGVRRRGLELDTVLREAVCGRISEDAGPTGFRLRYYLRLMSGLLHLVSRNRILSDLASRPTLTVDSDRQIIDGSHVWVLVTSSRKAVDAQLSNAVGGSDYAALRVDPPRRARRIPSGPRVLQYAGILRRCFVPFRSINPLLPNHDLAMEAMWSGDMAEQARELFDRHRPKALFIHRDFRSICSVLIQVGRERGIPTYTTQHSVTPQFAGSNYRVGNVDFENSHSDTFVCWGEFNRCQRERFLERTGQRMRLLVHCRPTSPEDRQLSVDKSSGERIAIRELIVSLMGLRHEEDNRALLDMVFGFVESRPYTVTIRLHPSLSREKYSAYIEDLSDRHGVRMEITDGKSTPRSTYTEHSLGITGLTSTYYEDMFFGVPVVFYDHGIQLEEELPRVLSGVTSSEELGKQVGMIEAMTRREWYQRADPVSHHVYSRACMDFEPRESMVDFISADVDSISKTPATASPAH